MASHRRQSNALSERSESKGYLPPTILSLHWIYDARRWHRRPSMPFVYILRCADSSLYIGETDDLDTRLLKHNDGSASKYTGRRRPVTLVYAETHEDRNASRYRERQLKRWTRAKKEALIANDLALLKRL